MYIIKGSITLCDDHWQVYYNVDTDELVDNVKNASKFATHLHALKVMHNYPLNKFIKTVSDRIILKHIYETDNIKIETHEF